MKKLLLLEKGKKSALPLEQILSQEDFQIIRESEQDRVSEILVTEMLPLVVVVFEEVTSSSHDFVSRIKDQTPAVQVIVVVLSVTTRDIINFIKEGAFDVISMDISSSALRNVVIRAWEAGQPDDEGAIGIRSQQMPESDSIVGKSPEMLEIYKAIGQVACSNTTVLIEGDSGTGKELVAREIVRNSLRSDMPFLVVNCNALPDTLLESELFGHEKGAFTDASARKIGKFEQSNGGTLFLDEIADMSPKLQGKVLRILQEQSFERVGGNQTIRVDVRIVAATNRSLYQCSKAGLFRWDLYYRLKVFHIHLPRMRDRGQDILLLARHFLTKYSRQNRRPVTGFAARTAEVLIKYPWPGNVRELENTIQSAVLRAKGNLILIEHLPANIRKLDEGATQFADLQKDYKKLFASILDPNFSSMGRISFGRLYRHLNEAFEAILIENSLSHSNGNQVRAAKLLGISRNTLRERIERYRIGGETD